MTIEARAVAPIRNGTDEDELSEHLRAVALGSYARNHAIIRLGRDTSFWHPESEPTLSKLAVFVHEHLHFIHNYSTIVGLYDFFVQLRLVRLYCNTVDREGKSHGEEVLLPGQRTEVQNVLAWRRHLRGSIERSASKSINRAKVHPRLSKIQQSTSQLTVGPQTIELHGINAVFDATGLGAELAGIEVQLGSDVLMEGCAVESECLLFEKSGGSASQVLAQVPVYPYLTARAVFEGVAGFQPSREFFCRICVLALESTNPGDTLVQLARASKTDGTVADEAKLLARFLSISEGVFEKAVQHVLEDSLQREVEPLAVRGVAGKGLQRMIGWASHLLGRRLEDRFFDLGPVEACPDLAPLVAMLRSLPTCPVVQVLDGATKREELLYFSDAEVATELTMEIGAAQSLFDLTDAHFSDGKLVDTPPPRTRACPFFNACGAPLAAAGSEICERRPWQSFSTTAVEGCWYAAGVASSRGRPDLEPRK